MADFSYPKKTQQKSKNKRVAIAVILLFLVFAPILNIQAANSSDPFASELWYIDGVSGNGLESFQQDEVIVAILDAGFDLDHKDLINKYWKNSKEIAGDEKDNDGNGFEDDVSGWDFVDSDNDPSPVIGEKINDTVASHGTLLAGIIAAEIGNGIGIAGITSNAKIMPLRIVDEQGVGTTAYARDAIKYAVKNGADVINLSFTSKQPDVKLQETIEWAVDQGVVIVSALGNDNVDTDVDQIYPACFDNQSGSNLIIGVAATNKKNQKADFSNYGSLCTDISAPGVNIFGAVYNDPGSFLFGTAYGGPWQGTSMAAPIVSAAAAILLSSYPSLTPKQVRLSLVLSADPIIDETLKQKQKLGAGLLNIKKALSSAKEFASSEFKEINLKKQSSGYLVASEGRGSLPLVHVLNSRGQEQFSFLAYAPGFRGGVRVAMGDVNGDGIEEIVTGAGPGGGPHVRVFDLKGNLINQFFAFDEWGREGINISLGDLTGDGKDEIIVTNDKGGTGQVRIFNQLGYLQSSFYPFGRTTQAVHVSVGNLDEDKANELAVVLGGDTEPRVRIFDSNGRYIRDFKVLSNKARGLNIGTGDLDRDGYDEIIVSADTGNQPWVGIYTFSGQVQQTFFAYHPQFLGGVTVSVGDIDNNGRSEIYTAPLGGGGPHIRIFEAGANLIGGFFASNKTNRFGADVAIW